MVLVLAFASTNTVHAARNKVQNIVKFNPLGMFNGPIPFNSEYRGIYERVVRYDISYFIGASYLNRELFPNKALLFKENVPWTLKHKIGGFGAYAGVKKYLLSYYKDAPRGLYVTPSFDYFYSKFASQEEVLFRTDQDFLILPNDWTKTFIFDFNTTFGYHFIINDVFIIDVFAGAGFRINRFQNSPDITSPSLSVWNYENIEQPNGIRLIFGFDMGFAW